MDWNKTIFIAHANEDKPKVRAICSDLEKYGIEPWLDENKLLPGDEWDNKIREAIKKSCLFLAFFSSNSVTKDGYFQREIRTALDRVEEKPPGTTFFIPILLEPVDLPNIKVGTISINSYQYARLYESNGLNQLIRAIAQVISIDLDSGKTTKPSDILEKALTEGGLMLTDNEMLSDRMEIEVNKIKDHFPSFLCTSTKGRITSAEGDVSTSHGNKYRIRIEVSREYPYTPPRIIVVNDRDIEGSPHKYIDGSLCVMNLNQWSASLSIAFMIAKASIWLNKCDTWKLNGWWPGNMS